MADELIPWINSAGEGGVRNSMQEYPGNGTNGPFEFNFSDGYIDQSHVKAYRYDPVSAQTFPQTLTFVGPNQVTTSDPIPSDQFLVLYRDTPKDKPLVDYGEGAVMDEANLDKSNKQAVFIAAEMLDRFDAINATSADAINRSVTAFNTANEALDLSHQALDASAASVSTANSANSKANTALSTANDAHDIATGIDSKAQSALDASAAAVSTANSANATANAIDAKASKALTDSANAVTTANSAASNANTALSTANSVSGKADAAVATANDAATKAANAYPKTGGVISGEVISTPGSANSYRLISGNYGAFIRNDGTTAFLMQTGFGDPYGTWNAYRPFSWELANGNVTIGAGNTTNTLRGTQYQVGLMYVEDNNLVVRRSGDENGYSTMITPGTIELRNYSVGAFIDFSQMAAIDFNYRLGMSADAGRWSIMKNNGVAAYLDDGGWHSTSSVYASGAVLATDGNINGGLWGGWLNSWLQNQLNNRVDWGTWNSNSKIWCGGANRHQYDWDGGAAHINMSIDGSLQAFVARNVSDMRLKKNIEDTAEDSLAKVRALRFRQFDWKDNDNHQKLGLVSQQVRTVDPALTYQPPGDPLDPKKSPLMLRDQALLLTALHAIQQLSAEVEALKAAAK